MRVSLIDFSTPPSMFRPVASNYQFHRGAYIMSLGTSNENLVRTAIGLVGTAAGITTAQGQDIALNTTNKTPETAVVTAQRTGINLLPKAILDTPQSINVIPAEVIREQGVT